jgi:excisionase family DNA binding protein
MGRVARKVAEEVVSDSRLLSISEAGEFLGVSAWSVRRLISGQHVIYSVTEGGHYRLRVADLKKYQKRTYARWADKRYVPPPKA